MVEIRALTPDQVKNILARLTTIKPGRPSSLADTIHALQVGDGVEIKFPDVDKRRKGVRSIRALADRNGMIIRVIYADDLTIRVARQS